MTRLVASAWRSNALRVTAALALGGLSFTVGGLILARILPNEEYARFALIFSLIQIGIATGPVGADIIVNRRRLAPDPRLLRRVVLTSTLTGAALAVAAGALYPLAAPLLAVMMACVVGGACKGFAGAHYQSRQRFGAALMLSQSTNLTVPLAAGGTWALGLRSAFAPCAILAVSYAVVALAGWRSLAREPRDPDRPAIPFPWREALSILAFVAAGLVLTNLDRLVIPRLLTLADLATFSVLATLAGSPFQMLHSGVGYALLPSLRNAPTTEARRRVLAHEAVLVAGAALLAAAAAWWITPFVADRFLAGRYGISQDLVLAVICIGALKPAGSLAVAAVNAVGTPAALGVMGVAGWVAVAAGFGGAWVGARWGLLGLLYGVGLGWLVRGAVAARLAARSLQDTTPAAEPTGQTDEKWGDE